MFVFHSRPFPLLALLIVISILSVDAQITSATLRDSHGRDWSARAECAYRSKSAPSAAINSSSGGQVSSTLNAARMIQLGVKFMF